MTKGSEMRLILAILVCLSACNAQKQSGNRESAISCPSTVSKPFELKAGWKAFGIPAGSKILYHSTLVTGGPSDTVNPEFDEEHIDEWENTPDGFRANLDFFPGKHDGLNLRCDYFPSGLYDGRMDGTYQKTDGAVTLLLPLPDKAGLNCVFLRNPEKKKFEATCSLAFPTSGKSR